MRKISIIYVDVSAIFCEQNGRHKLQKNSICESVKHNAKHGENIDCFIFVCLLTSAPPRIKRNSQGNTIYQLFSLSKDLSNKFFIFKSFPLIEFILIRSQKSTKKVIYDDKKPNMQSFK